jgi:hypothetical protein
MYVCAYATANALRHSLHAAASRAPTRVQAESLSVACVSTEPFRSKLKLENALLLHNPCVAQSCNFTAPFQPWATTTQHGCLLSLGKMALPTGTSEAELASRARRTTYIREYQRERRAAEKRRKLDSICAAKENIAPFNFPSRPPAAVQAHFTPPLTPYSPNQCWALHSSTGTCQTGGKSADASMLPHALTSATCNLFVRRGPSSKYSRTLQRANSASVVVSAARHIRCGTWKQISWV